MTDLQQPQVAITDEDGQNVAAVIPGNAVPLASDPALNVTISPNSAISVVATNPSVGLNGAAAPTSSTQIGGIDPSGFLQSATILPANTSPTSADKALVVTISPNSPFPASDTLQEVPFTYLTSSPLIVQAIASGARIEYAALKVTTAFDDPAAELQVGTVATPTAMLDIPNPVIAEYENEETYLVAVAELFRLIILPGASTQGAGILFYRIKP